MSYRRVRARLPSGFSNRGEQQAGLDVCVLGGAAGGRGECVYINTSQEEDLWKETNSLTGTRQGQGPKDGECRQ